MVQAQYIVLAIPISTLAIPIAIKIYCLYPALRVHCSLFGYPKLRVRFPFMEIINVSNLTIPNKFSFQSLIRLKIGSFDKKMEEFFLSCPKNFVPWNTEKVIDI